MSADLLRRAADALRGRAEDANPGPWSPDLNAVRALDRAALALTYDVKYADDRDQTKKDAAYIATMHPGVGLALADTLDAMAARAAELTETLPPQSAQLLPVLVRNLTGYVSMAALARLIVGGDA